MPHQRRAWLERGRAHGADVGEVELATGLYQAQGSLARLHAAGGLTGQCLHGRGLCGCSLPPMPEPAPSPPPFDKRAHARTKKPVNLTIASIPTVQRHPQDHRRTI